jgi:hypothetical protein
MPHDNILIAKTKKKKCKDSNRGDSTSKSKGLSRRKSSIKGGKKISINSITSALIKGNQHNLSMFNPK